MSIETIRDLFDIPSDKESYGILSQILHETFQPNNPFSSAREPDFALNGSDGAPLTTVLAEVRDKVVPHAIHTRHPGALAHMVPPPLTVSVIADLLIGALNQCAFIWEEAPVAARLEAAVIRWMCERVGFGAGSGGILTSGGTMSNTLAVFLALQTAKRTHPQADRPLYIVATDQAHLSVEKAAALVGLGTESVLRVQTGVDGRLHPGGLCRAIGETRGAPFMFICTAGTTNAGIIEPCDEFLALAREHHAWCHVDAAYGGFVTLTRATAHHARPWRFADSISWDPHKSLHASYGVGTLLLRNESARNVLRYHAAYALRNDAQEDAGEAHFEGSRRLEALKLWMCIRNVGLHGYGLLVDQLLDLTMQLADLIRAQEELELVAEPETAIVCFRYVDHFFKPSSLDVLNNAIQQQLFRTGGPLLSATQLAGRQVLRAVILNPRTTHADLVIAVKQIVAAGRWIGASLEQKECRQLTRTPG
jgi:L-2,4-diaminobutyrate decarboxylase